MSQPTLAARDSARPHPQRSVHASGRRRRPSAPALAALLGALAALACGSTRGAAQPDTQYLNDGETSMAERYLPLTEGTVYEYVTRSANGTEGMMTIEVLRRTATSVELNTQGHLDRVRLDGTGYAYFDGGHLLKVPLVKDHSWEGKLGVVRVVATGLEVAVPAGKFSGCIRTEERGTRNRSVVSVYCPGTGMVSMDVQTDTGSHETAVLRASSRRTDPLATYVQPTAE